jgi:hypothetical protein
MLRDRLHQQFICEITHFRPFRMILLHRFVWLSIFLLLLSRLFRPLKSLLHSGEQPLGRIIAFEFCHCRFDGFIVSLIKRSPRVAAVWKWLRVERIMYTFSRDVHDVSSRRQSSCHQLPFFLGELAVLTPLPPRALMAIRSSSPFAVAFFGDVRDFRVIMQQSMPSTYRLPETSRRGIRWRSCHVADFLSS